MKCPECVASNQASRVYRKGCTKALMGWSPYYDEDGKYHSHDGNVTTAGFSCSNGHYFQRKYRDRCPSCDFGGETEGKSQ